jgi:hypothetical protein
MRRLRLLVPLAGRLPSGGWRATINADGSIDAKYGWWRAGSAKPVTKSPLGP